MPQPANVNIDSTLLDIGFFAPDLVEQLRTRVYAFRPCQQEMQQAELSGPEGNRLLACGYTVHASVAHGGRPCRLPQRVRELFI